jgi:hypothetical protein
MTTRSDEPVSGIITINKRIVNLMFPNMTKVSDKPFKM